MEILSKHVIVTGGSSGIGLAVAHRFAAAGACVSLIARDQAKLEAAAEAIRPVCPSVAKATGDVSDEPAVRNAIAQVCGAQGPCDILITSAGVTHPGYFEQLDGSIFRRMMEVDYFGTLYCVQAVVPSMMQRRTGSLVSISSAAGLIGVFGYAAYAPAKFAVRGLMESLRQEMTPYGIHCGVAYPPDTDTPMLAWENQFKPLETERVAGTIKPVTADRVARSIVEGVRAGRRVITADPLTALLVRAGGILEPLLLWDFDRKIREARAERGLQ